MNDDQHLRRKFREEADDSLFMDIRFDERMKARIRARIQAEEEQERKSGVIPMRAMPEPTTEFHLELDSHESETKVGSRSNRRSQVRRRWAYGMGMGTVASLVIAAAITFSPWLTGDESGGTLTAQPGDLLIESAEHATAGREEVSPLVATETESADAAIDIDIGSTAGTMASAGETAERILSGPDEAATWFGEPLMLPTYLPEGYRMEQMITLTAVPESIETSSSQEVAPVGGAADTVRVLYTSSADDSFELTISKQPSLDHTMSGDKIELDGVIAYWQSESVNSLRWKVDHLEYQLTGTLDMDEMIRIAASISR